MVVAAFNQEKALVGAFSVITNLRMELFQALVFTNQRLLRLLLSNCKPGPDQLSHAQQPATLSGISKHTTQKHFHGALNFQPSPVSFHAFTELNLQCRQTLMSEILRSKKEKHEKSLLDCIKHQIRI